MGFPFNEFKKGVIRCGLTNFDFVYDDWVRQEGDSEKSIKDLYWAMYNKMLVIFAKESSNDLHNMYNKLKAVYWEMRMFLIEEGKNPNHIIKAMNNCDLQQAALLDFPVEIEILGGNYCSASSEINGKKYPLKVMLENGLLPYPKCNRERACNCIYLTIPL